MAPRRKSRDKEITRARLLQAGFDEVYAHGFQAASIDRILERLDLTKGAFFHHFPTKQAFGYALVDETIADMIRAQENSADTGKNLCRRFGLGHFTSGQLIGPDRQPLHGTPSSNQRDGGK